MNNQELIKVQNMVNETFISGVYKYFKTKNSWKMKKEVYHAKRNKAKARALKLYKKSGVEE